MGDLGNRNEGIPELIKIFIKSFDKIEIFLKNFKTFLVTGLTFWLNLVLDMLEQLYQVSPEQIYLPLYSAALNLIENYWHKIKKVARNRIRGYKQLL